MPTLPSNRPEKPPRKLLSEGKRSAIARRNAISGRRANRHGIILPAHYEVKRTTL